MQHINMGESAYFFFIKGNNVFRGGSRRVAKFLQESILIAFDFLWKVLLPDRNVATLPDSPLVFTMNYIGSFALLLDPF